MARLSIAFDEAKETVGSFILDAITPMVENIVKYVVPAITAFVEGFEGGSGLKNAFTEIIRVAKTLLIPIFEGIKRIFDTVKKAVTDNEEAFTGLWKFISTVLAPFLGGAFKLVLSGIAVAIGVVVTAVGKLISAFQALFEIGQKVKQFLGFGGGTSNINMTASRTTSAPSMASPSLSGGYSGQAVNYNNNITVNGAIDPISTARQINQVLGNAATSSGSFLNLGLSNAVYV
jgi:phage-related protein